MIRVVFACALCTAVLTISTSPAPALAEDAACALFDHAFCSCGCQSDAFSTGGGDQPAAFQTYGPGWTQTSSTPSSTYGQSATITWSIVPDGTTLPRGLGEPNSPSNLVQFLDDIHYGGTGPGGSDLTQRSWWQLFDSVFQRWDELSGLTCIYEPNDDGAAHSGSNPGVLGVRGDVRIGGHSIDGQVSPTYLAYNYYPRYGDMVIDTDEVNRWGDPTNNYLTFRNAVTHEIGHGLGLKHVISSDSNILMEPYLSTAFDGPQLDDILGLHCMYGDALDAGIGNDTFATATPLGAVSIGNPLAVGTDADDMVVLPTETDFVSIDYSTDVDYFSFSLTGAEPVTITLTPKGPTYMQGPEGGTESLYDTAAINDLYLQLIAPDGINRAGDGQRQRPRRGRADQRFPSLAARRLLRPRWRGKGPLLSTCSSTVWTCRSSPSPLRCLLAGWIVPVVALRYRGPRRRASRPRNWPIGLGRLIVTGVGLWMAVTFPARSRTSSLT